MTSTQKENVVVVGGGVSGVTVAQELSKKLNPAKYNLILIEPRPHHIWLPATLRMAVKGDQKFTETVTVPLDRVFAKGKGSIKRDKVEKFTEGEGEALGELKLASGETLQYRGEFSGSHLPPLSRIPW